MANPPGPPARPLVGNLIEFTRDPLAFLTHCAQTYGDITRYRVGPVTSFLLNHPDHIQSVLVDHNRSFVKGRMLRAGRPLLGNGLTTGEGAFWLRQRRLVQPAFHRPRLVAYAGVMVEYAERCAASWRDGEVRDIHRDMNHLAQVIAAKTLFDADIADRTDQVRQALNDSLLAYHARARTGFLIPTFVPSPGNVRLSRAVRRLDRIMYRIIRERRASPETHDDVLSMLIQARDADGAALGDKQLRDEVTTLFVAGHEPVGVALAWTWYLLAKHPRVQEQLFAELTGVLKGRAPGPADLPQLPFTEWVVKESLRLYPPIWGIVRMALTDLEIGGYSVRAGNSIAMSQWVMQRDARYFQDPHEFRPGRWGTEQIKRLPRFAYFPFGGGPRVCIGDSFAMMECCLVLAALAPQFRFELAQDPVVELLPSITLHPKHGIRLRLVKRGMMEYHSSRDFLA